MSGDPLRLPFRVYMMRCPHCRYSFPVRAVDVRDVLGARRQMRDHIGTVHGRYPPEN